MYQNKPPKKPKNRSIMPGENSERRQRKRVKFAQHNDDDDDDDDEVVPPTNYYTHAPSSSTGRVVNSVMADEVLRKDSKRDRGGKDGESKDGGGVEGEEEMDPSLAAGRDAEGDDMTASANAIDPEQGDFPIEPFNLRQERDTGRFDKSGNYVWNRKDRADGELVTDAWLQEVDGDSDAEEEADANIHVENARAAKVAQAAQNAQASAALAAQDIFSKAEWLRKLTAHLIDNETVLSALARLGGGNKKRNATKANKPKGLVLGRAHKALLASKQSVVDEVVETEIDEAQNKIAIKELTLAADALLGDGLPDLYTMSKRSLVAEAREEEDDEARRSGNGIKINDESSQVMWQYKLGSETDAEVYGPYPGEHMQAWREQGFFSGDQLALVRKVGQMDGKFQEKEKDSVEPPPAKRAAVDELMEDLSDDDDADDAGGIVEQKKNASTGSGEKESEGWVASNLVDFVTGSGSG